MTAEERRLEEVQARTAHWRRWATYLSERQWGRVREDYSAHGSAWDHFPHDHARSRAYRWGEDGLLGISDNHQRLCFALALWNEKDPILKERMFGLTGSQGNHGEDVKDYYFYLDSTPTHSYMTGLYKYPQGEFPYVWLVDENQRRGRRDAEFELVDTGVFESDRYFDVVTEYAKAAPDDLLIRITVTNRGPDPAPLHLLPTLWCRNTWAWEPGAVRPRLRLTALGGKACILVEHAELGRPYRLYCDGDPALLFTENDTNLHRVHGVENPSAFVKDGFHEYVVHGQIGAVNPAREGTKTAAHYRMVLGPGESAIVRLRLTDRELRESPFGKRFDAQIAQRVQEADEFYATVIPEKLSGDANPPVHAWAVWRVYKIDGKRTGRPDREFLEGAFHKLLLNFNWWVNRKDAEGMNVFQGGFLGLDNIGVFDRSAPLPTGGHIEQSDGTAWMAMYTLNMLAIALELASENPVYEDVASKFWEHFLYIANAMSHRGDGMDSMWNTEDGFFYDVLHLPDGERMPMKVRSMVGLIPLFAVQTLEPELLERLPNFKRRLEWFIENRRDLTSNIACMRTPGHRERRLLSIVDADKLHHALRYMLDENEFLSPHGIRALSRYHMDNPYVLSVHGTEHRVDYQPAESKTSLFGGNSNWRGPIWFPMNFLLVESLQKFHHYFGNEFKVEFPTGSGQMFTLAEVAGEISRRLNRIFLRGEDGRRPVAGNLEIFQNDPHWNDLVLFHEYFHGDTGSGVGANHQTGWTGLVAKLLTQSGEAREKQTEFRSKSAAR